jgi:predicted nucleotidyltransferase
LKRFSVKRASLFGSLARGEDREDSDIDIIVEFEAGKSLLDLAGLKIELEELLSRRVPHTLAKIRCKLFYYHEDLLKTTFFNVL